MVMIRAYKRRTDMTHEELTEHKRKLKHQQNINYYKNKKQKLIDNVTDNVNDNSNDDGIYNMLNGLYELLNGLNEICNLSQDDNTIEDIEHRIEQTEDSIFELEYQLNIPLEQQLIYYMYIYDDDTED